MTLSDKRIPVDEGATYDYEEKDVKEFIKEDLIKDCLS